MNDVSRHGPGSKVVEHRGHPADVAKSAHTPGPWRVYGSEIISGPHLDDAGHAVSERIAEVWQRGPFSNTEANAARIVACVNYCEGYDRLPDTSLRELENSYASGVENLNRVIASATAERDRLAAHIDHIDRIVSEQGCTEEWRTAALLDAIAKARAS